jgi:magnesium-transporting ATPase (P-type)
MLSLPDVCSRLHIPPPDVSFASGLSSAEAAERLTRYGPNVLEKEETMPVWRLFLAQLTPFVIILLQLSAIVSMAFGEYIEGAAILFIVFLNATIATYTEQSAASALEALADISQPRWRCVGRVRHFAGTGRHRYPEDRRRGARRYARHWRG